MFKLLFKLLMLVLAVVSAVVLGQQAQLSFLALNRIDPLPETRAMLAEERYAEAGDYLSFFMDYAYVNQNSEAQRLHKEIATQRGEWTYQLSKLSEGLLSGSSDETIGQAASVAADFFVIGDIRDLAKQSVNLAQGEEVDQVLVALSTLGVVATAAQVASGAGTLATAGAAAPAVAGATVAKSGLVALKTARRLGNLPAWLRKTIVKEAKVAQHSKSLVGLSGVLADVNTLSKTRGGFKLLGQTKNADELRYMARFAETFGAQSATMYRVGGRWAVNAAQHGSQVGKETIKYAATFGQGGLKLLDKVGVFKFSKIASRASKMAYKGDIIQLLIKLLLLLPLWLLYVFIIFGAVVWMPWRILAALNEVFFRRGTQLAKTTK